MPASIHPLSRRILSRLRATEAKEPDPWLRDDLQVARLTVLHAALGDATICCGPHVLASYEVLGLHPDKVWPKIVARRKAQLGSEYSLFYDEHDNWRTEDLMGALASKKALGLCDVDSNLPRLPEETALKKPPQSVKLWWDKSKSARAVNSRADVTVLREPTTSVPMAAPSIAALYPNSDASSSGKTRHFNYEEMLAIVEFSGAPHSIRQGTLSALKARGRWPNEDGPATGVVCVSLIGMMLHGVCCRSTARWRARRACALGYWRQVRRANSWSHCPKCGTEREAGTCAKCAYSGRAKTPEGKANFDEFCRPYMYEIDIDKFRAAQRPREIRHFDARTYAEYKEAARRGERPNVTEMPRKQPEGPPPPKNPAPARQPEAPVRRTAEHQREERAIIAGTAISDRARRAADLLKEMCGLADIGALPQIAISIAAEAKFRAIDIEAAAKLIAECATRDQKNGIALTRFYFRDLKWRSNNGGTKPSASSERAERSKRNILDGFAANARGPDAPDGPEREE